MQASDQFPFDQRYDWKNKVFLGQGSYGKVYKAKSKVDGQYYAIKQMKMDEFNNDPTLMNSLKSQISITKECNSANTVNMYEFRLGHNFTYIVLELCEGDLRHELSSKRFAEQDCVHVYEDLMKGFEELVKRGYIHRDIKPANVLVKNHHYKVADFGFACKADLFGKKKLTDICGTPIYMAPQLLANQPYTAKSDIWSLGLMLYEMIFGYPPWPCRSLQQYRYGIQTRPLTIPFNAKIGENTKDFLKRSLVVQQQKRMGWNELLSHPLIKRKEVGQTIKPVVISDYLRNILAKLQADIKKNNINVRAILEKHKTQKVDINKFGALLHDGDPTITSYEIKALFDYLDVNKQSFLSWNTVIESVAYIDYRDASNILDRKLDDLVAILRCLKESPVQLFNKIDINHSGSLDWAEFSKFINSIAPRYTKNEVLELFRDFDINRSGLISKEQFIGYLQAKLPSGKQRIIQQQRARRNIKTLISYLKWSQITPETVLKLADINHDNSIEYGQFRELLKKLNFVVSQDETFEIFTLINKDKTQDINLQQLVDLLK